ncbi:MULTISPECIES: proline dehydrogenase family protein [Sphingobacterium]|uniref:proline dehydrogenase family protein n=1 Tax=Sphingobacterium TaxID=28453 RepID=UPI00257D1493|nr:MULTISPECIES: proline dehydrogenase family protein [Sphingobacterium]
MEQLLTAGAEALRKAALNEDAKAYVLNNEALYKLMKKAADRYIGGENLTETLKKVQTSNDEGFKCSIEYMGESTRSVQEATKATDEFLNICNAINQKKLNSTISLDLSHIGLEISENLCYENLSKICEIANDKEVIISAEGTERTDRILKLYQKGSKEFSNLSITLQAYLHRTADDFEAMCKERGRIRIVKGAFETAKGLSLPRGQELNERYLYYVEQLFSRGHLCSIATHHHEIQQEVKKLIDRLGPKKESYEFESLFGIQTEQLAQLRNEGYPTKLYFVYGQEWYLYLCNRLAEYPLNLFRALQDIVEAN